MNIKIEKIVVGTVDFKVIIRISEGDQWVLRSGTFKDEATMKEWMKEEAEKCTKVFKDTVYFYDTKAAREYTYDTATKALTEVAAKI